MTAPAVPRQSPVFLVGGELTEAGRQTIAKLQGYFVAEGNDYEAALDFAWHEIRSDSNLAREAYREIVDPEPPPDLSKAARRWLARTNRWVARVNAYATRRRVRVLPFVAFRPREARGRRPRAVRARRRSLPADHPTTWGNARSRSRPTRTRTASQT